MKIQSLFTKGFLLTLVCISVVIVTIFRLTPSFAVSTTTTPTAQLSTTSTTIAQYNSDSERSGERTLYQRLGGYNAIAAVIDDTAQNVISDPLIGRYFVGLSTNSGQRLRQFLIDQFCQAAGGPCIYTGRTMKLAHSGMGGGLTNSEFDAFANGVARALDKNGVKQRAKNEVLAFVETLRSQIVER